MAIILGANGKMYAYPDNHEVLLCGSGLDRCPTKKDIGNILYAWFETSDPVLSVPFKDFDFSCSDFSLVSDHSKLQL